MNGGEPCSRQAGHDSTHLPLHAGKGDADALAVAGEPRLGANVRRHLQPNVKLCPGTGLFLAAANSHMPTVNHAQGSVITGSRFK